MHSCIRLTSAANLGHLRNLQAGRKNAFRGNYYCFFFIRISILTQNYFFQQKVMNAFRPTRNWGPIDPTLNQEYKKFIHQEWSIDLRKFQPTKRCNIPLPETLHKKKLAFLEIKHKHSLDRQISTKLLKRKRRTKEERNNYLPISATKVSNKNKN